MSTGLVDPSRESNDLSTPKGFADCLVRMVQHRDWQTGVHLDATGKLARRLSLHLGYDIAMVERIEVAARLHDVGKHTIDLALLTKAGSLSGEEWEEMRRHPDYGATILRCFPPLEPLAEIVRLHHERIDGRGYPEGRAGSEIPLESRVIAVVDAFHAMTVARPYQKARMPGEAMRELVNCAGSQFDPEFVEAFIGMFGANALGRNLHNRDQHGSAPDTALPYLEANAS